MRHFLLCSTLAVGLCACSPPNPPAPAKPAPAPVTTQAKTVTPPPTVAPLQPDQPGPVATPAANVVAPADSQSPVLAAINGATPDTTKPATTEPHGRAKATAFDPLLVRAEALLARARFSPGVVDGRQGSNFKHAVMAFQAAHQLEASGTVDADTWQALTGQAGADQPVSRTYTITPEDIAGPFAPDVGEDFVKLAAQPDGPRFATPLEALAERFHMSQALLTALNPKVDFQTAGANIVVIDDAPPAFSKGDVASVEVSKADASASAYDKAGELIAFYPATVGSTERPSPSGVHKVLGVSHNPDYVYDPSKLAWGPRAAGKLTVKPGPNNPVGTVWIALNAPSYGIHGSPDPETIGKTASHGCVRLTNWDAEALAAGVKPGVKVSFVGRRKAAKA